MDRRRNLLTLIARHLLDNGYVESAERVQAESSVSLSRVDVADNMDLLYILGVSVGAAVAAPLSWLSAFDGCVHGHLTVSRRLSRQPASLAACCWLIWCAPLRRCAPPRSSRSTTK